MKKPGPKYPPLSARQLAAIKKRVPRRCGRLVSTLGAASITQGDINTGKLEPRRRKVLEAMIEQMNRSTKRADAALDAAFAFIAESEKRIAAMEVAAARGRNG